MKTMIIILTTFFLFTECGQEEPEQQLDTNSIYGTWKLVALWLGNVGDADINWNTVNNGHTITFSNNMSYSSTEFTVCNNDENIGYFLFNTLEKKILKYLLNVLLLKIIL